jgi:hypothetical protein
MRQNRAWGFLQDRAAPRCLGDRTLTDKRPARLRVPRVARHCQVAARRRRIWPAGDRSCRLDHSRVRHALGPSWGRVAAAARIGPLLDALEERLARAKALDNQRARPAPKTETADKLARNNAPGIQIYGAAAAPEILAPNPRGSGCPRDFGLKSAGQRLPHRFWLQIRGATAAPEILASNPRGNDCPMDFGSKFAGQRLPHEFLRPALGPGLQIRGAATAP